MKKSGIKFDARISMLVIFTTAFAMMILGIGFIVVFLFIVSRQNKNNIEYILNNAAARFGEKIAFIDEAVISIRHNSLIHQYLKSEYSDPEPVERQLAYSMDLFSERNRSPEGEPFVTRLYLFNGDGEHVSIRYYPETLSAMEENENYYLDIHRGFILSGERFHVYESLIPETRCIFIKLFDDNMDYMGTLGVEFNMTALGEPFEALQDYSGSFWIMCSKDGDGTGKPRIIGASGVEIPEGYLSVPEQMLDQGVSGELGRSHLYRAASYSYGIIVLSAIAKSNIYYNFGVYPILFLAVSILVMWLMAVRIAKLRDQVYEKELVSAKTQVKYLQSQLNPHFQYNILAMLAIQAKSSGSEKLYRSLRAFSNLVRGRIFREGETFINLWEEMELVDFYLFLQKERFGDRLFYSVDYDREELGDCLIPRLIIEPLVENAIEHGIEPKATPGRVDIIIDRTAGKNEKDEKNKKDKKDEKLRIRVFDDGVGMSAETGGKDESTGTSIANIRRLLQVLYPDMHSISIASPDTGGTHVEIMLPLKR